MRVFKELNKLNLPEKQFVVIGSGIMGVLGIRESKDIDLLISKALFDELRENQDFEYRVKVFDNKERISLAYKYSDIEIFFDMDTGETFGDYMNSNYLQEIEGMYFMKLERLLFYKNRWKREKDLKDIELINTYLKLTN